jgi:hypothetical protein
VSQPPCRVQEVTPAHTDGVSELLQVRWNASLQINGVEKDNNLTYLKHTRHRGLLRVRPYRFTALRGVAAFRYGGMNLCYGDPRVLTNGHVAAGRQEDTSNGRWTALQPVRLTYVVAEVPSEPNTQAGTHRLDAGWVP